MWKWGVGALIFIAGCGSDEAGTSATDGGADASPDVVTEAGVCAPGVQSACTCAGGSEGTQTCTDDGTGWEACVCADASPPDAPVDAAPDAPVDAPPPDAPVDAAPDAPVDGAPDALDAPLDVVQEGGDAAEDADCGDPLTDPDHCGRCNHSCLGGACVDGMCEAFELATVFDGARGLAVDATQVYVAIQLNNAMVRIDKATGAIGSIEDNQSQVMQPSWVAVDSESYYWTNRVSGTGSISKCPIHGCGGNDPTVIVTPADRPNGIAADGTSIYWAETYDGTVKKADPDGSNVVTLVPDSLGLEPFLVTLHGEHVYFSEVAGGRISRVPTGGGTTETMAVSPSPARIAVTDAWVFWADTQVQGAIYRVPNAAPPTGGHTPEAFAIVQNSATNVVVDDENVYWIASHGWTVAEGAVRTCPVAGCPPSGPITLADGLAYPFDLAIDDRGIYFTVFGLDNAVDGAVMAVAKP